DALLVANGHHWDPRWPEPPFPGRFDGDQLHSHHYVENTDLRDKNVLVVGIGNSAMDIAVESSFVARKTFLSSRRGAYILPKYLFGRPLDQIGVNALTGRLPWGFRQAILSAMYRVGVGRVQDYGLPEPDHKLGIDNLAFIGVLQPLGATMPLAEAQGRWRASYLRGESRLPPLAEMEADVRRERDRMFRRYVASKRHTMQVDFDNYLYELGKE